MSRSRWFGANSIWRVRSFQLYWLGYTISAAGTAITRVVLPILVFQVTASTLQTTTLLIIQLVPCLTLGPLAAAIGDRVDRRLLMIGADLVNAAALSAVPIMAAAGMLTVPTVYTVALVSATAYLFGNAAEPGALRAIVRNDRQATAASANGVSYELALVLATALGGVLAATIGAASAVWVDVTSYLASALALARIPRAFGAERPAGEWQLGREIREGLRYVWGHHLIRPLTLIGFGNSVTAGAVLGLLVVYGVRQLGLADDDARLGLLFSAGWAGAMVGGLILPGLARRVGRLRLTLVAFTLNPLLICGLAFSGTFPRSLVMIFAWQLSWVLIIGNGRVLRQHLTPDWLQGRVNITAQILSWGGLPFGAALGGVLADLVSVQVALLVTAIGVATSVVYAWCSALRHTTDRHVQLLIDAAQGGLRGDKSF